MSETELLALVGLPAYYACDVCGHLHSEDGAGDCDNSQDAYTAAELDSYHPEGWVEL